MIARPLEAYDADQDVRALVDQVKAGMRAALKAFGTCTVEDGGGGPWWHHTLHRFRGFVFQGHQGVRSGMGPPPLL